ncbi:MAG: sugar ABC transporter substrate-binding protein [Propionibacteriaceae bacterium]|jgi:multiple sugar transport system substrate-binding protein/sorbitol/mannitol transport system substrate-binding protein|nr:sugar ABC transporter substrate-binding protein [Propionibacteriaceae bacterium]
MRRIVAASAAACLVVSLAACSPGDQTPTSAGTPAANVDVSTLKGWGEAMKAQFDGTNITVAMASHPSTDAFKAMEAEFTELTGISITWDIVEETNLKNKQLLDAQGGGNYDVMMVDAFWMSEYASKKVLDPVATWVDSPERTPGWFDYEDIMPAYRNGIAGSNGTNYGIPTAGETRFIAYRTDLFEKYGKEPPKNMDEYLELAKFFNGKEDGLYGVSMRAQRGIHFASGWMSLMYNFGGGFLDQAALANNEVKLTVDTPETKQSLQFYVDLLRNAPPDVGSYTHEEALNAFMVGSTAMWLDATALANQITDPAKSKVADNVGFVSTPTGPKGDGAALAGWNLGISAKSSNKDAAWAFIAFMASKEKAVDYVKNGGVATRGSVFENSELAALNPSYPAQKVALESANGLVEKGLSWIPQYDQINQILDIAGTYGSDALAGNISVDDAVSKITKDAQDLIG